MKTKPMHLSTRTRNSLVLPALPVLLALALSGSQVVRATSVPFTAGDNQTWTCPPGVTSVTVECWGAGGAGGSVRNGAARGGGGGGGGYLKVNSVTVTPGQAYTFSVPTGAAAPTGTFAAGAHGDGSDTTFPGNSVSVTAKGGIGGSSTAAAGNGTGGAHQNQTGGNVNNQGGDGATGITTPATSGGGGGGAGDNGSGANGTASTTPASGGSGSLNAGGSGGAGRTGDGDGNAGVTPAGGGAGAKAGGTSFKPGGKGGDGKMILTYTLPHYQSAATGNWSSASTWSTSQDNVTWTPASAAPTSTTAVDILITGNHTVTNDASSSGTNLTVDSGSTLVGNAALALTGTTTINGTLAMLSGTITGTLTYGASSTLEYAGAVVPSLTEFPASSGPANLKISYAGTVALPGSRTLSGTLTIDNGSALDDGGFTLTAHSSVVNNGTHRGAGRISLTGSSNQFLSGTGVYGNLELNNAAGATLNAATTINGRLTLTSGALKIPTTTENSTAAVLQIGGADQLAGTWGSTASAADHKNDTVFDSSGNGILSVGAVAVAAYKLTGTGEPQVGLNYTVTVTLVDSAGITNTGYSGIKSMTFNTTPTLSPGADSSVATINGVAQNTATNVTFISGVATVTLVAHKAESSKVIRVTDGTYTSDGIGGSNLTVSPTTVATKLGFGQQPTAAFHGAAISPAVTVHVEDLYGNVVNTNAGVSLAITAGTGSGGAVLTGGASLAAVAGTATFGALSIDMVGTGYTLEANSTGLTGATSNPVNVTNATITSAASANWNVASTWTPAVIPIAGDAVIISAVTTVTVPAGYTAACSSIANMPPTNQNINGITLSDNTSVLNVAGDVTATAPTTGTIKKFFIDVGAGTMTVGGNVSLAGTAQRATEITLTTGTLTVAGNITSAGDYSRIIFTGAGTLNVGGTFMSGVAGTFTAGTGTVTFNGSSAQSVPFAYNFNNLTLNNSAGLSLSANSTVSGTLNLTVGTLAVGAHTLTLNGPAIAGTPANLTTTSAATLVFGGSSTGILVPTSVAAVAGLTINNPNGVTLQSPLTVSGSLTLASGQLSGVGPYLTLGTSATLTLAGGKLDLETTTTQSVAAVSITSAAVSGDTMENGSLAGTSYAASNTTGNAIVSANLLAKGTAGLTKSGTGVLTLTGNNSYTGKSQVNAGTLVVNGNDSLATGAVTVATTATLGGHGNLGGNVTIQSGGHHALAVATTVAAQLTRVITGTLTMDAGSILDLTASATPAPGTYVLATATTITGTLGTPTLTGIPAESTVAVITSATPNRLELTVPSTAGFDGWITTNSNFANPGLLDGKRGPNDDPDGDGTSNLVEYAIAGMDPTVSNGSPGTLSGKTITFAKRTDTVGISYAIETSTDLGVLDKWDPVAATETTTDISYTLPDGAKDFLRLLVTQQ